MESFLDQTCRRLKERLGSEKVICALSGGVDSSVVALLLHRVIGDRLQCIFVNNGLLRKNEASQVVDLFRYHFKIPLHHVDAEDHFLKEIDGDDWIRRRSEDRSGRNLFRSLKKRQKRLEGCSTWPRERSIRM